MRLIAEQVPELQGWRVDNPLWGEACHGNTRLASGGALFLDEHQPGQRLHPGTAAGNPLPNYRKPPQGCFLLCSTPMLPPEQVNKPIRVSGSSNSRHIKYRQPMVRLRLLDAAMSRQFFQRAGRPADSARRFRATPPALQRVIILENKTNFFQPDELPYLCRNCRAQPDIRQRFLGRLKGIEWIKQVELLCWGDLDARGLPDLSRGYFPTPKLS